MYEVAFKVLDTTGNTTKWTELSENGDSLRIRVDQVIEQYGHECVQWAARDISEKK